LRPEVNKLEGVDSEVIGPAEVERLVPFMDVSPHARHPILGALYHPPGGIIRHDAVNWGYARAAAARGVAVAPDLAEAFEYLQQLRLRHQVRQLRAGVEPDNLVPLSALTELERRWLRDLFRLIEIAGQSVRLHLQTDLAG
jgi:glycine/D-amino acid oxidase-like deaminating enzyme